MSTASHAIPNFPLSGFAPGRKSPSAPSPDRRRSSPQQGRGLEILGHAIEYLVDSRLYDQWESPADAAAVQLLMSCSRKVFNECEAVQTWRQRIQTALLRRLHLPTPHGR